MIKLIFVFYIFKIYFVRFFFYFVELQSPFLHIKVRDDPLNLFTGFSEFTNVQGTVLERSRYLKRIPLYVSIRSFIFIFSFCDNYYDVLILVCLIHFHSKPCN